MTTVRKWLTIIGPVVAATIAVLDDNTISPEEAGFLVTTVLSAFGIWPSDRKA